MLRLCCQLALWMVVVSGILALFARSLGSTQPPNPALTGFIEGCTGKQRPCWYGILPSITKAEDGKSLVERQIYKRTSDTTFLSSYIAMTDDSLLCKKAVFLQGGMPNGDVIISTIVLSQCSGIKLGDLMTIFPPPSFGSINMPMLFYGNSGVTAIFSHTSRWYTSPFAEVESIRLQLGIQSEILTWRGFMPRWRHCQGEHPVPGC